MTVTLHGVRAPSPRPEGDERVRATDDLLARLRRHTPPGRTHLGVPLTPGGSAWLAAAGIPLAPLGPPRLAWRGPPGPARVLPRAMLGATAILAGDADVHWTPHGLLGPAARALAALIARVGAARGLALARAADLGAALLDEGCASTLLLIDARALTVRGVPGATCRPGLLLGAHLPRPTRTAATALDHALARRWLPNLAGAASPCPTWPRVEATLPPTRAGTRLLLPPPSALDRPVGCGARRP